MTDRMLRPMSLPDIFDEGFDLYKKNFPLFLMIAAVVAVPVKLVEAFLAVGYVSDAQGMLNSFMGNSDTSGFFFWFADFAKKATLPNFCFYLAYCVAVCALAEAASQRYIGRSVTTRQAYVVALKRLPALILAAVLYLIGMSAGFMVCGVLMLWPLIVWLFSAHTFTIERLRPVDALKRSNALVANDGGRVFSALILLALLGGIIQIGLEYPLAYGFELLLKLTPQTQDLFSSMFAGGLTWRDRVAGQLGGALSTLLLVPFFMSVLTVLYYDLRVRKEAFDVELLASDLGYAPLSAQGGYLPAAMVFQPFVGPRPQYGVPPPPPGYIPPPAYRPPGYAPPPEWQPTPPPPGYQGPPPPWQPSSTAAPPPGWQPPSAPAPPPGWQPPTAPPSTAPAPQPGWQSPNPAPPTPPPSSEGNP